MKFRKEFKELITKLKEDPTLREAILRAGKFSDKPNFTALPQTIVAGILLAGKLVGKNRVRTFATFVDAVVFLVSVSVLIKQNVFDRPEVQEFLTKVKADIGKTASQVTAIVRDYVEKRIAMVRRPAA